MSCIAISGYGICKVLGKECAKLDPDCVFKPKSPCKTCENPDECNIGCYPWMRKQKI